MFGDMYAGIGCEDGRDLKEEEKVDIVRFRVLGYNSKIFQFLTDFFNLWKKLYTLLTGDAGADVSLVEVEVEDDGVGTGDGICIALEVLIS